MAVLRNLRISVLSRNFSVFYKSRSCSRSREQFVPRSNTQPDNNILSQLRDFVDRSQRLFVLTGAGISTESGIRDYRSEKVGLYAISTYRPVQHEDFVKNASTRQRCWARNYAGWPTFSSYLPNKGHQVLADLEKSGKVYWLVTQNVDSLHSKAGSKRLTELHGSISWVICLSCRDRTNRHDLQEEIRILNPDFDASPDIAGPDGDGLLIDVVGDFKVPDCSKCGGVLKPDVVFFGDSVPRRRVDLVYERLKESDAVLALGSSLEVKSAHRYIVEANQQKLPLAIVNIGTTRADKLATLRVCAKIGEIVDVLNEFIV